jgi:hypothetical protein
MLSMILYKQLALYARMTPQETAKYTGDIIRPPFTAQTPERAELPQTFAVSCHVSVVSPKRSPLSVMLRPSGRNLAEGVKRDINDRYSGFDRTFLGKCFWIGTPDSSRVEIRET